MNAYALKCSNNEEQHNNLVPLFPQQQPESKPVHLGKSSEVFGIEIADAAKLLDYFKSRGQWLNYLLAVVSINTARRNKDVLSMRWNSFFDPATGRFRKDMASFTEHKTSKKAAPHINDAVKDAIRLYLSKVNYDPSVDNYEQFICYQHTGTHKGTNMTYSGCRMAIKRAAKAVGIEDNVGTHTYRKTFGKWTQEMNPNDPNAINLLQSIYNHSSPQVTLRYMGYTKKMTDGLYDDIGEIFKKYASDTIIDDAKIKASASVVTLDNQSLRDLLDLAYQAGMQNAAITDPVVHIDEMNAIYALADEIQKRRRF